MTKEEISITADALVEVFGSNPNRLRGLFVRIMTTYPSRAWLRLTFGSPHKKD